MNGEPIAGSFYEKELQKTSQKNVRIEKVLKRKGDRLYVKWKGYDNSFSSWIDKKYLEWNFLVLKRVSTFLSHLGVVEGILMLRSVFQIMQQKLILKI